MITIPPTPEELLIYFGVTEPSEIRLEGLAWECGVTVMYEQIAGAEAGITGAGDRAIISVNSASGWARRRFSVAHELGHWAKQQGKVTIRCGREDMHTWSQTNPETQANQYAADLLMPEFMFRPRAHGKNITFESVRDLASEFQTSLTATAIRLVQQGSYPSMVVWTKQGKRSSFKRSSDLSDRLWPSEVPGRKTLAYRLAQGEDIGGKAEEVVASEWFDHDAAVGQWIVESAITMPDGAVVSLLWWEDEGHLAALGE